ncbi:hypothetical protein N7462_003582 [Penicillium macrosclerotiorum]|uniref:uncharacterized protein n=1 Tax=Penicillium macrosclerotiorum TaxID=303699 RepID=UPI002547B82D|nr:uncharacterized protein N7462_003582 [Penicillium macrosclerotiorum]KAJ5689190.1 hypothetical protein N7462_003582 [Penicillium macrosclerotiorum]
MATQALADWAVALTFTSLPPETIHAAIRSFYNWAGCTIGGSTHPATTIARTALARFSGPPTSRLLGAPDAHAVDAMNAALLNGIASHVHDYDDTHLDTIIHPTGPVASALLAIAQTLDRPISGSEFLTALVVGIEAECKVGLAVWPSHYDVGWHITGTTGSIGAAVAVAKLLGLSAGQTAHAIGIAATQVTGLREMFGSHTKSFHAGRAAQNGLLAAVLAEQEYTSSVQALEAKRGWASVVSAAHDLEAQMATLGAAGRWEIERNAFKPFPCGIVVHPVIDGLNQVREIEARVHPLVVELTGKTAPKDGLEGKFSVYHGGAVGVLFGKATPAQYEDEVVADPRVVSVRERITVTVDTTIRSDECHLVVRVDGEEGRGEMVIEKHVDHAVGSLERPMTDEQLKTKFKDQCASILGQERTEKASQWCWSLDKAVDIRQIKDIL